MLQLCVVNLIIQFIKSNLLMATVKWALDPTHSEIGFKVKHLMFTNVSGHFRQFSVQAETNEEDFSNAKVVFSADVESINTNNEQRDAHLKSADFFDAATYPQLTFTSTGFSGSGEDWQLTGDLTLHGVTKQVTFTVEFGGIVKDPWGNVKAGFSVQGKINRKEFGLNWNAVLESGGVMVSEEVKLHAEIQLVKEA